MKVKLLDFVVMERSRRSTATVNTSRKSFSKKIENNNDIDIVKNNKLQQQHQRQ